MSRFVARHKNWKTTYASIQQIKQCRRNITWPYMRACIRVSVDIGGCIQLGSAPNPLTATLPLIWTAGRGESRKRFDDFDGLVRAADWLPPTSCRTFDEIQTFGPIPSASCGYQGPRNGVVYFATTMDTPWIPEDERVRSAASESSTIDAPVDPISGPRVLHAKQIGPRWSIEHYRISRSRFTTDPGRIYIHDEFLKKNFWSQTWCLLNVGIFLSLGVNFTALHI